MTQRIFIWLLFCLAGVLPPGRALGSDFDLAETAATLRTWHTAEGLPSDSVTAIAQTRDGFLWVGTAAGLVRFDGAKFTPVRLLVASTNNPVHVTALCEDSEGRLWVGSQEDGLFELSHGAVQHYMASAGMLDDGVTSLAADKQGMVWVGTKLGLNLFSAGHFQSFTKAEGLADVSVSGVNVARSGTVWITTRSGMYRFAGGHIVPYEFKTDSQGRSPEYLGVYEDRRGNYWAFGDTYLINLAEGKRFNYFRSSEPASIRIWSLCEGRDGRLWIGTSGRGLFCFAGTSFQPVVLGENRWSYDVRAICEDFEGNLWLGTSGGGLVQLRPQSMQVLRAGQGLPVGIPTALALDARGKIFAGLRRNGLFTGEFGRFDRVSGNDLPYEGFISGLATGTNGTVWAATLGNGLYGLRDGRETHLTTADGLADDDVLSVCVDRQGAVWAGTAAGTVHRFFDHALTRYGARQGLPGTAVTALIPSVSGGLWLGTRDGQILHGENGNFAGIQNPLSWGRHAVLALQEDGPDLLWIGTSGGGLECLNKGAMVHWGTANGLPSDLVAGVAADQEKNLWLVTGVGIYRVNRHDLTQALDHPDMSLPCRLMSETRTTSDTVGISGGNRAWLAPDGELWFATSDGVLNVDTRQTESVPPTFPVYIESAAINGQPPVSLLQGPLWPPPVHPPHDPAPPDELRSVEFEFTALSYLAPEDMQFRHKLDNSDADWVNDGPVRSVRYGRLPSGHYVFHVAARHDGGPWQDASQTFAFVVPTPVWFQPWAIFLYGVAAVLLVSGIVRLVFHRRLRFTLARLEQQQSLERERMRIARDMHDEMGSKLTKISFLSEHAQVDAQAAGPLAEKIQSIAQTSRELLKTMDEIVWVVNPRNDTLENLTNYLSHYAVEYFQNTSVECELSLPQEIPNYAVSSEMRHNLFLTFEEALNNVLKHAAATVVKVEIAVRGLEFEMKITDNGKGFAASAAPAGKTSSLGGRRGNGLKNMRQRLETLGGECQITSQPGTGTTVALRFRLSRKPAAKL